MDTHGQRRIGVDQLKIGMYVVELDRPWLGSPFLFQGFPITSTAELDRLRSCCRYVYVLEHAPAFRSERRDAPTPSERARFSTRRLNIRPTPRTQPHPDAREMARAVDAAREIYTNTHAYIGQVLEDARLGQGLDTEPAREAVGKMIDSIVTNPNALTWLSLLKSRDEYTSFHSLNVCILSLLFAQHLGLPPAELHELGLGALLHDIGKMQVPLDVLNKPAPLEPHEMELMKQHPSHGYEALRENGGVSARALDIVYSHHERFDGTGYPRGLKGAAISRDATIVAIADVYDAITTDRVYHPGISPHEALRLMYEHERPGFREEMMEQFIRCLSIYPIGSIVELETGEVGVVMTINHTDHLRPIVALVLGPDKQPYPAYRLFNLSSMAHENHPINIKRILRSNAFDIDVQKLVRSQYQVA